MTDQPEGGPCEWTIHHGFGASGINGPYTEKVRVVEHSALQRAEARIIEVEAERLQARTDCGMYHREFDHAYSVARKHQAENDSLRVKLTAAEARVKELEHDIDGTNGWRDSCAFFEKRAEADEQMREMIETNRDQLRIDKKVLEDKLAQAERMLAHANEAGVQVTMERDNAIARITQLQVTCGDLTDRSDTLKAKLKEVDKDLHSAEVHVKDLIAENERLRAELEEIAVMDEQDEPYSAEIARKALKTTMENK